MTLICIDLHDRHGEIDPSSQDSAQTALRIECTQIHVTETTESRRDTARVQLLWRTPGIPLSNGYAKEKSIGVCCQCWDYTFAGVWYWLREVFTLLLLPNPTVDSFQIWRKRLRRRWIKRVLLNKSSLDTFDHSMIVAVNSPHSGTRFSWNDFENAACCSRYTSLLHLLHFSWSFEFHWIA